MEDSLGPPKATVNSLIKDIAGNYKFANNYGDLIMEISQEYIAVLAAEANKICLADGKKTIAPDHVFRALKVLKMDEMTNELHELHEEFLKSSETRHKAKNEAQEDLESLEEYQKQLFEASKNFTLQRSQSEGPQGGAMPVKNDIPVQAMNAKPIADPFKAPQFKNDNDDDYENFE